MMAMPAKFVKRVQDSLKKHQGVITQIKKKDANESDTVTVITDILQDVFGYDKYSEITSEYAIRGTYCDLAIIDQNKKIRFLIEVKAVSVSLSDNHIKQAIDYGSNAGVNWVILTNSERWLVYKIRFGQPIDKELIAEFNLLTVNPKLEKDIEPLFIISKDGQDRSVIDEFYVNIQVKNKFIVGAILNSEEVHSLIRRNLRKLYSDVQISVEEIADIMANDIIKREIIDSEESKKAKKDIEKMYKKLERKKEKLKSEEGAKHAKADGKPDEQGESQ